MKRYVVGFLFNPEGDEVVLVLKTKPDWQRGRLNGVGGKVEPGDAESVLQDWIVGVPAGHGLASTYLAAMKREWREETGDTSDIDWKRFDTLSSEIVYDPEHDQEGWEIAIFAAVGNPMSVVISVVEGQKGGEETLVLWEIFNRRARLLSRPFTPWNHTPRPLPNVTWLLPKAWAFLTGEDPVEFATREVRRVKEVSRA